MMISAFGITAPFISLTVPCNVPVTVCAITGAEHNSVRVAQAKNKIATACARAFFDTMLSSYLDSQLEVSRFRGHCARCQRCGQCDSSYWKKCSKELLDCHSPRRFLREALILLGIELQ